MKRGSRIFKRRLDRSTNGLAAAKGLKVYVDGWLHVPWTLVAFDRPCLSAKLEGLQCHAGQTRYVEVGRVYLTMKCAREYEARLKPEPKLERKLNVQEVLRQEFGEAITRQEYPGEFLQRGEEAP